MLREGWSVAEDLETNRKRTEALRASLSQSIRELDQISSFHAELVKKHDLLAARLARHYNHDPRIQPGVLSLLRMLRPMAVRGAEKVRIGRKQDGGYVMIDDFAGVDAAYSIGIGAEVSWDLEIAGKGIVVFQYDHTIEGLPESHANFRWRKLGLGAAEIPSENITTLSKILKENGHAGTRELIMKIDIEDAEWDVFGTVEAEVLQQFRQIVAEFHNFAHLGAPPRHERIRKAFAALTANHCPVHVHANNHGPYLIIAGVPVPETLEVTFVRKDGSTFDESSETFPTRWDAPNNPNRADYWLGAFRF